MGRTQEPGGDYGYDLVHQDLQPGAGRPRPDADGAVPAGRSGGDPAGDLTGDYAYDEAHDF